ncbi:sugar phosphate isomerase/epimerase [Paenibacillus glycanilyticus]|uniref:sugar phosphate isomerase/epimerase family protein n=1 Tax=Paenibacillus glycanilyticus TaxID=126569 RepID=UPI00203F07B9|nr:TIM barrel protein [Paenibacillus glycanilyticus]MCM3626615.1 sugar phosphate isomerase/epimerase [Paenibacillus glycanilyticus]
MASNYHLNDGTNNPPRMELQQSWWAMIGLGENGREWTMEEKFERIAAAGFTGISATMPAEQDIEEWHRLLDKHQFTFSTVAFPSSKSDMQSILEAVKQFGRVQYINSQVMDAFVVGDEAVQLLQDILEASSEAGIPHFIETHRGRITQDLLRTTDYVRALPQLKLIIDFSHYIVAGELDGTSSRSEAEFDVLLQRTAGIHGRISNGEQVQVDMGKSGDHPMARHFKRWWRKGMQNWYANAVPGDVLSFVPELGPPGYAITRLDEHGRELETTDRWQQALLLKQIAEELWQEVVAEAENKSTVR